MQDQLGVAAVEAGREAAFCRLIRKGADNQDLFIRGFHAVGVHLGTCLEMFFVNTVADAGQLLAQTDGLAVEIQNGIGVGFLLGDIDVLVVMVYIKPRRSGGEAGIFRIIPLDRGTGGVRLEWA